MPARIERVTLRLRVQPGAATTGFAGDYGDRVKLKVSAPPAGGAANEAVLRFLAEVCGVPRSRVQLIAGAASRNKTVRIVSPCKIPRELASRIASGSEA
jgi:uncharacterized protein (TIGR00251 family)